VTTGTSVDGVLVQWGETLFYPANRIVRPAPTARVDTMTRRKAAVIRQRIVATVVWRAPQVMVKVTGGGRGMGAIAAHFRYISKNGKLSIEDDRGVVREGKEAMHDLVEQWRHGGSLIDEVGYRREAFNIMLSMPDGTDAQTVLKAAREFAKAELLGHRYVMVLHQHQANPHVHLSVRAESMRGDRLNPRKTDLHRWRETFAEKLRGWGIAAEATRQATRGVSRNFEPLWRLKAKEQGRLRTSTAPSKTGQRPYQSRADAAVAWAHITKALAQSHQPEDQQLAEDISRFLLESPFVKQQMAQRQKRHVETTQQRPSPAPQRDFSRARQGPKIER
jgi:uncharacterized membrane-anchored protein YhcB (DUF1043 family)